MIGCSTTRVKIVDDLRNQTTIVETPRERGDLFFDLVRIARAANRKKEEVRMSVHLTEEFITVHWYSTAVTEHGSEMMAEVVALADPIRQVEAVVWNKGGLQ